MNFADCPARLPVHFDSMPAFSDGIMPQKHFYPQILPTPTHVGRFWPVLTSSGVFCPVTLFLPHDPDALLHSVTVFFSVSSLLSSPSLSPSLSLHHATQFPSHATSSSRSVSTQSEVEPTPTSSLSSASTTAQSPLSSNIQPSNLFQSSKPASPASPHPPDILPGSLSTLQPPASGSVSSIRASGPFLNTQPQELVQSSAQHSDPPVAIPQYPDILLGSKPPLHPVPSSTSSIFTLKYFPPELQVDFHVYLTLRRFLDELLLMHALAKQDEDAMLATAHSFVPNARRAFDARFREWAPEVTGHSRSLPMACPPPPRPFAADPART